MVKGMEIYIHAFLNHRDNTPYKIVIFFSRRTTPSNTFIHMGRPRINIFTTIKSKSGPESSIFRFRFTCFIYSLKTAKVLFDFMLGYLAWIQKWYFSFVKANRKGSATLRLNNAQNFVLPSANFPLVPEDYVFIWLDRGALYYL